MNLRFFDGSVSLANAFIGETVEDDRCLVDIDIMSRLHFEVVVGVRDQLNSAPLLLTSPIIDFRPGSCVGVRALVRSSERPEIPSPFGRAAWTEDRESRDGAASVLYPVTFRVFSSTNRISAVSPLVLGSLFSLKNLLRTVDTSRKSRLPHALILQ